MKDKAPKTVEEAFEEFYIAWDKLIEEIENESYKALDWLSRLVQRIQKGGGKETP